MKNCDAIYTVLRGDTDWTMIYYGSDLRKIHDIEEWCKIHCAKTLRVRGLDSTSCYIPEYRRFYHA